MKIHDIPQIVEMSIPEKILLVEELWDDIAANGSDVPVPESHRIELDKRLKRHAGRPESLLTFEDLQERITRNK